MKLFEYAVIREEKRNKDGFEVEAAEVVVPVTAILARDEDQANLLAARAIPEAEIEHLDRLLVVVRPFDLTGQAKTVVSGNNLSMNYPPVLGMDYQSTFAHAATSSAATYTPISTIITTAGSG